MAEPNRPRIPWRIVIAIWMLPAIADVADTYIARRLDGHHMALWRMAALIAPGWLIWIVFTPFIFWFGAQIPITRPIRARAIAAHFALSIVVGMAHGIIFATCVQLFDTRPLLSNGARFVMTVEDWLPISMLLYWMTLFAGFALEGARRERAQAVRTTELEGQLARSELAVLRAQLHPHFLFNALNTAVSLVRANQPEAGVHVLTHLADLLRQLVTGVEQEVPLREELRMLDSYLEIERARFGNRLTITVDIPEFLLDAYVPGLVLQPLVENALRHGVGMRDAAGHVSIAASERGDILELRVGDDGPGFALDVPDGARAGVGIANTRARLSKLYGALGALALHNASGGGAEVVASMPLHLTPVRATAS